MDKSSTELNQEIYASCELKIDKISFQDLRRNDLVFFQNDIWRCESINMCLFQNLQTRQQTNIPQTSKEASQYFYLRIEKLELIPKEWKHAEKTSSNQENMSAPQIMLKGQELGLGPIHEVEVVGMRKFEELEVVRSQKLKGREIPFKVILCKTKKPNCYLIGGVDFLN